MRILFDQGHSAPIARYLKTHAIAEAKTEGWDRYSNGALLAAAEAAGFEVLLTTDKNMQRQRNLQRRKIAIVVFGVGRWRAIKPVIQRVTECVNAATPGTVTTVDIPLPSSKSSRTPRS